MPLGTETLASALHSVGYRTYLSGKWHLGSREEWGPNKYGFDHSYGSLAGMVDPWTHEYSAGVYAKTWHRNGKLLEEEGNATELIAAQACKWIKEKKNPWFIYVPFHAVHVPVDTPDEYREAYRDIKFFDDPKKNESYWRFAAFVSQLDAKVGDLVNAVDESGQRENTLIVFTSDNGGLLASSDSYKGAVIASPALSSNAPLRGQKATLYEGGIRVIAFANWKGVLQPQKLMAPIHATDWMPTLTKLAGYVPKADLKWDGLDIWPLLTGVLKEPAPRTIYIRYGKGAIVRNGNFKLYQPFKGVAELYDLTVDPSERTNLAESKKEKVIELQKMLEEQKKLDEEQVPEDLRDLPN